MASRGVGLPQVGRIGVSGYVALRLPLPVAVVTYFVTGSRTLIPSECTIVGTGESKGAARLIVPRPVNRTPQLRSADKLIGNPVPGGDVGDPIANQVVTSYRRTQYDHDARVHH